MAGRLEKVEGEGKLIIAFLDDTSRITCYRVFENATTENIDQSFKMRIG